MGLLKRTKAQYAVEGPWSDHFRILCLFKTHHFAGALYFTSLYSYPRDLKANNHLIINFRQLGLGKAVHPVLFVISSIHRMIVKDVLPISHILNFMHS
jgi:hypothetical protein